MITYSIIQKSQLEGALRLDAEYYQPEYLSLNSKLKNQKSKFLADLAKNIICGPFGSAILQEDYRAAGVPLIRVSDLNDWFVRDDDLVFIKESLSEKMKRYQVTDGDIVVSQRGTIAMFSRVTNIFPKWNISANLISIKKSPQIDFDYLLAFLNSFYGINQLYHKLSGQVQPKITTDDVRQILIFVPDIEKQREIAKFIQNSRHGQESSKSLYSQAENLLLTELGLSESKAWEDETLSYIVNLSEAKSAHRADAEYFQPKYEKIVSLIRTNGGTVLGDLATMKKGIEPGSESYQDEGKLFIRVSSLSKNGIEDKDQKYLSDELYQKLKKNYEPKVGEILLTKDATPGVAYVMKEPIEGIVSGGILRLKLKNEKVENEYLALCLNSVIGQMQAKRDGGGSIITHWRPEQIKNILIPILSENTQKEIEGIIKNAYQEIQKSNRIYSQAENLLLEELGLKDFKVEDNLSYIVNLSEIKSAHRADAEYFQPKYNKLVERIKKHGADPLLSLAQNVAARFNPKSQPTKLFQYVELSNITSSVGTIDGFSEVSGDEAPSRAKRVLKTNDVILSSVEGSLEKVALAGKEQEGYLASNGFFQFRSKDILPEVLLVLAKSFILQMQFGKETAGTILTAVPKEAVKNIVVPKVDKSTQQKIADLVQKSHETRSKAKQLLEQARQSIESLIEG